MAYAFVRQGDQYETKLEPIERAMLRQMLDELCEMLTVDNAVDPEDLDPLAVELGLEDLSADDSVLPDNPVLNRLLPDGYRDDPMAAYEFRRYTDGALRRSKIEDAELIRAGLDRADSDPEGEGTVLVSEQAAPGWLRSMNDLRLALGVQLEITDDSSAELAQLPEDDPRAAPAAIYDFLTWWQDSLVRAVVGED